MSPSGLCLTPQLRQFGLGEEEGNLPCSIFCAVRGMDGIPALRLGEELPNGARSSLSRVSCADRVAHLCDGILPFQGHGKAGSTGHERHELSIERPSGVDRVECRSLRAGESNHARGSNGESRLLTVGHDGTGLTGCYCVRLYDAKG